MTVDIEEKVEKGWIHLNTMVEVQGNDKELVGKALKNFIEKISKEKLIILIDKKYGKIKALEKKWYSNHVELELLTKGFEGLVKISTHYSPSSMEILKPKELKIPASQLQNGMLDISALITTFAHAAYLARKGIEKPS